MLLENFYKIIHRKEREDGKREIEIELNPGHALYQGHFPGQPVVPGVCTLQMIKESAEQMFPKLSSTKSRTWLLDMLLGLEGS